jgi:sugar phosphate isomerase/epimerase
MKNIFILLTFVVAFSMTKWFAFSSTDLVHPVENWHVGTYDGLLDEFSLEELDAFREAGIQYLELSINPLLRLSDEEQAEWVRDLNQKTENAGIRVWSVHMPWSNRLDISTTNEEDRIHTIHTHIRIMELLEPLQIQKYVMHPSAEPIMDNERPERLANAIASLRILAEESKKFSGAIAVEVMPRTLLGNTSDEILQIIEAVNDGLEICFDTNHVLQETPEEFVRRAGSLITTLHVSDYDGLDEKHWLPGRGIINWNQLIRELVQIGYEGPWMYEVVQRAGDDPVINAKTLVEKWESLKKNYIDSLN